jgi:hypothetical protein
VPENRCQFIFLGRGKESARLVKRLGVERLRALLELAEALR